MRLSVVSDLPDLERTLAPLEEALGAAVDRLGLETKVLDGRRAVQGALHIIWADLIDMSPDRLRKHWAARDIPEAWAELHGQLLVAVEAAIARVGAMES
jgi:hypothetical protein